MTMTIHEVLDLAPVIPVVLVHDADDAVPLARALVAGGLPAIEVALRTPAALAAIARIADELPAAVVGAGAVVDAAAAACARRAGAEFLASPGATRALLDALQDGDVPLLAGAATASEITALLERGITAARLFPAEAMGGITVLRAAARAFPQMRFCPSGGINLARARHYVEQENVACVGGSWMAPADAIGAARWDAIVALAEQAAALAGPGSRVAR